MTQDKVLNIAIKMIKKQNKTERDRIKKLVKFRVERARSGGGRNSQTSYRISAVVFKLKNLLKRL